MALLRPEHHWPSSSTVACSATRMCPCKRRPLWAQTVTDVFVYELLMWFFHIGNFCFWVPFLKQLLLRNCEVDFVEICNVYVGKMIIKAAKRIFYSDKMCRSYSDLNFWNTVYKLLISKALRYGPHVTKGSHSFTCHPHTNRICLYSSATRHHRPLAGTHCAYPRRDGQAELTWVAGRIPR